MNDPVNTRPGNNDHLDSLLTTLRDLDARNFNELRRWKVIMSVMGVLMVVLVFLSSTPILIIDVACLFIFFMIYTYSIYVLSHKDYSLPIKQILINNRKSLRLLNPLTIVSALAAAPMIYGGIHVLLTRYILKDPDIFTVIIVFGSFYVLVLIAAYVVWYKRYNRVLMEINRILKELDE